MDKLIFDKKQNLLENIWKVRYPKVRAVNTMLGGTEIQCREAKKIIVSSNEHSVSHLI